MQQLYANAIARAEFVALDAERRGYYALAAGAGPFPAVLVYQEAFGVNDYVQSEVRRLAEHGYAALAPDLFRGDVYGYGEDERPAMFARLQALTEEGLLADVRAAVAFLDAQPEVARRAYGAVGFCMGGRLAVLSAIVLGEKIAAAASFYGGGIAPEQPRFFTPLRERLAEVKGALLLIYGADDEGIAPSEHARIAETLSAHKKRYTLSVYPGAPHGFASRDRESYRPAQAEAAWAEALALFDSTLR
jgi:carboxymethylenebutenolidase